MKLHILKIKDEYFDAVLKGYKTFELRKNDRDFQVGDLIHFIRTDGDEYGFLFINGEKIFARELSYQIIYILKDVPEFGLDKDYCILGIKQLEVKE